MPLSSGDILANKYRIEAEIGRGVYGRVYRATDVKLGVVRAIKELAKGADDLGSSQFADFVRRFEREARVQAGFNHRNIVHVYELIQEGADRLYLVMEYVDGESLRDALAQRGPLPIDEAVSITADLLAGLAAVHADPRDIVHRDVKPSNVLLTKDGQAKLADFGLAQVGDESLRSGAGQPHPGTPAYMSPEQETTSAYLYPASDIFSVGCVLFEMLTGVPYKRAKKERKGLAELRPDAPPWLAEITASALAKDPDDHPANAAEMGRMLAGAKAKVEAEVKAKAEAEERARRKAQRKAEEEAQRARLAEQERQQREAAERTRKAAELQAQAEALRKSAEESQKRRQAEEVERARQEAERKAQAEAEAVRRAKREQERREAVERALREAEAHAASRRRLLPWVAGGVAVLVALVLPVWRPWTNNTRVQTPTSSLLISIATRSVSALTATPAPERDRHPSPSLTPSSSPTATAPATKPTVSKIAPTPSSIWTSTLIRTPAATNTWTSTPVATNTQTSTPTNMTTPRRHLASVSANGYVYAIGGWDDKSRLNSVEFTPIQSDGSLGTWRLTSSMNVQRGFPGAVAIDGYLYVIGGDDGMGGVWNSVERAATNSDGSLGKWQFVSAMTGPRYAFAVVATNGYLYAIGGDNGHNIRLTSVERAAIRSDGSLGNWEQTTPINAIRAGLAAVAANNRLYVLGGWNGSSLLNSVEWTTVNPDGSLGKWNFTSPLVSAREFSAAVTMGKSIYAIGGDTRGSTLESVEQAVISDDGSLTTWQNTTSMSMARTGMAAVTTGDIYVIGGDNQGALDSAERIRVSK